MGSERFHIATLSALAHLPPETPPEYRQYEQLFATAGGLGLGYEAFEQLFRRMAFNVMTGECDDHPKNFAFRLRQGGKWELAPAYDLTGSDFPSADAWCAHAGTHQLSVNNRRRDISDEDLLAVADRFGIGTARRILDEVCAALTAEDVRRDVESGESGDVAGLVGLPPPNQVVSPNSRIFDIIAA